MNPESARAIVPDVSLPVTLIAPAGDTPTVERRHRRARPSPQEHARRVAWGKTFGPMVGRSIRDAIREAE